MKHLHAFYSLDVGQRDEFVELRPLGSDHGLPYDTRINLPIAGTPGCQNKVNDRCLIAIEEFTYPGEALSGQASGMLRLTGTIARDGKITHLRIADATGIPRGMEQAFSREAMANFRTWRFESATRQDTCSIVYSFVIDPILSRGQVVANLALPNRVTIRATR